MIGSVNIKLNLLVKLVGSEGADDRISPALYLFMVCRGMLALGIHRKYFHGRTLLLTSCLPVGL